MISPGPPVDDGGRSSDRPAGAAAPPHARPRRHRGAGTGGHRCRGAPCAVIGVSDAWGTLHLQALSGPADRPTTDSRFFLASVTKPIVATAVMQLVDESRLDLHEPLVHLLPELAGVTWRERITAWHVLTHTAGLADVPSTCCASSGRHTGRC